MLNNAIDSYKIPNGGYSNSIYKVKLRLSRIKWTSNK